MFEDAGGEGLGRRGQPSRAVAAAVQCPYCIDAYTNSCLQQGCDESEIAEAFHVANAIRGGAALAHGVQALKIIQDQEL